VFQKTQNERRSIKVGVLQISDGCGKLQFDEIIISSLLSNKHKTIENFLELVISFCGLGMLVDSQGNWKYFKISIYNFPHVY
jgi:hypothetical protein